jgi:uncharacterized protein YgbK (DUF1537 family)
LNSYLVVADDFTGANDTGVQIRRRGIPVRVVFSAEEITGRNADRLKSHEELRESCVLDTESRSLPEQEAFQKLSSEAEKISFQTFSQVIKKVDSTLRGNIGAETRGLDQCYKPELIIFAPAFPDLGRTTVNRIHCLDGTPVSQTELAGDPKTPVRNDDIQKIMAGAFAGEKVIHIGLDALRGGTFRLEGSRVFCFDAVTNKDMETIAKIVLASEKRVLWVGAAALVDNLLNVERYIPPALAVAASLSSVTRGQILFAEKQGISLVKAPLYDILEKTVNPEEIAKEAIALLKEGKDVILLSSSTYSEEEYRKTEASVSRAGLSSAAMGAYTQKVMGSIVALVLGEAKISGLFLTGGDTAISCF